MQTGCQSVNLQSTRYHERLPQHEPENHKYVPSTSPCTGVPTPGNTLTYAVDTTPAARTALITDDFEIPIDSRLSATQKPAITGPGKIVSVNRGVRKTGKTTQPHADGSTSPAYFSTLDDFKEYTTIMEYFPGELINAALTIYYNGEHPFLVPGRGGYATGKAKTWATMTEDEKDRIGKWGNEVSRKQNTGKPGHRDFDAVAHALRLEAKEELKTEKAEKAEKAKEKRVEKVLKRKEAKDRVLKPTTHQNKLRKFMSKR